MNLESAFEQFWMERALHKHWLIVSYNNAFRIMHILSMMCGVSLMFVS